MRGGRSSLPGGKEHECRDLHAPKVFRGAEAVNDQAPRGWGWGQAEPGGQRHRSPGGTPSHLSIKLLNHIWRHCCRAAAPPLSGQRPHGPWSRGRRAPRRRPQPARRGPLTYTASTQSRDANVLRPGGFHRRKALGSWGQQAGLPGTKVRGHRGSARWWNRQALSPDYTMFGIISRQHN